MTNCQGCPFLYHKFNPNKYNPFWERILNLFRRKKKAVFWHCTRDFKVELSMTSKNCQLDLVQWTRKDKPNSETFITKRV